MTTLHLCTTFRQLLIAICDAIVTVRHTTIICLLDHQFISENMRMRLSKAFPSINFIYLIEKHELETFSTLPHWAPNILKRNISFKQKSLIRPFSWQPPSLEQKHYDIGYIYHSGPFMAKVVSGLCRETVLREDGYANYVIKTVGFGKAIVRLVFGLSPRHQLLGEQKWIHAIEVEQPEKLPLSLRNKARELKLINLLNKLQKKDFQNLAFSFGLEELFLKTVPGSALLLTQPIDEAGICTYSEKTRIYQTITDSLIKKGLKVYVKHHPNEASFPLNNVHQIPKHFPIELLPYLIENNFEILCSLCSTSTLSDTKSLAIKNLQLISLEKFNKENFYLWPSLLSSNLNKIQPFLDDRDSIDQHAPQYHLK